MSTNQIQGNPDLLDFTNSTGSAIASNQLVQVGDLHGVAVGAIATGATGVLRLTGFFRVPKLTAAAGDATTLGGDVFFSSGSVSGSSSSGTRKKCGNAVEVAAQATTTVVIRLSN